jgi:YVTN family beta-propeller protein
MRSLPLLCLGLLIAASAGSPAAAAKFKPTSPAGKSGASAMLPGEIGPYQVTQRWKPGGDGGWDYLTVDSEGERLYFGRSTRVQVLDAGTGALVGEVPDTPGIHGVALVPELNRGYTSNGRDSSVTVFDLTTLATVARIQLDQRNPDAILYEPTTKRVLTFNGGSASVTAIDVTTNTVVATLPLGDKPEFAVHDGKGTVYVNLEDSSAVVAFDAASLTIRSRWPLGPGQRPTGLALDREHRRLFSTCSNDTLVVLDATNGRIVAVLPIAAGVDGAAFDPGTRIVFASCGEGSLALFQQEGPDRYRALPPVPTQRGARTLALDPRTHRIFTVSAQFGEPPAPTPERPHPRGPMMPGTFEVLVLDPEKNGAK